MIRCWSRELDAPSVEVQNILFTFFSRYSGVNQNGLPYHIVGQGNRHILSTTRQRVVVES